MKKVCFSLTALLMAVISLVSCSKDEPFEPVAKAEYVFMLTHTLQANEPEQDSAMQELLASVFDKSGLGNQKQLLLTGTDRADVASQLEVITVKMEAAIEELPFEANGTIIIRGAEKSKAADPASWTEWYRKTFGTPDNSDTTPGFHPGSDSGSQTLDGIENRDQVICD